MTEYNISLAKCIEEAVNTAGTLTYSFNRVNRMDGYTDEFKHQKRLALCSFIGDAIHHSRTVAIAQGLTVNQFGKRTTVLHTDSLF